MSAALMAGPAPGTSHPRSSGPARVLGRSGPAPMWRTLRTHRRCAPEHAGQVRQLCVSDRSVLPRWHQDDRGRSDAHRGIHVAAPDGAYSRIACWRSREHWLTWVVPAAIGLHRDVLRRRHVDPDTFRTWATVKSGYAHAGTGRCCVVRPDTLASVMDMSERTVQRCTAAAREMGLEVVVLAGRMLTFPEVAHARRYGSRQRGLSTEVALTNPQVIGLLVDHVTPTRGRRVPNQTSPSTGVPHGLTAEQKGAAPPRPDPKEPHRKRSSPAGWCLAQELARSVPWLATEHPARLAPALTRFAACRRPWQAADIVIAIADHTARLGAGQIRPEAIRTRPAALLAAILRHLDPITDHPALIADPFSDPAPEPCGDPDCDHGWITQTRPEDGHEALRACPRCPPTVRTQHPSSGPSPTTGDWDPLDPPF